MSQMVLKFPLVSLSSADRRDAWSNMHGCVHFSSKAMRKHGHFQNVVFGVKKCTTRPSEEMGGPLS